jgi:hypothetical protein
MTAFAALIATYALCLGSITFPYATSMFAHAGTIGLLAIALWAMFSLTPRHDYVAGLATGLAVASEYPAVIPAAAMALYLVFANPVRALRFCAASLPAALLILANNYLISGSPLAIGYGSNPAFPEISSSNAFGFNAPDFEALRHLLWGEYRSLLFWSPAMLLAVPGIVTLFREDRRAAWLVTTVVALVMLQVASFYSWFGGNAVGPRYLAPAIPFIAFAAAYGIKRFPIPGAILTIGSVMLMGFVTAIAIDPPQDVLTPMRSFYLVRLGQDRFVPNLGTLLGLPNDVSLIALAAFVFITAATVWWLMREPKVVDEA